MALSHSPQISLNGLTLCLDAGNPKSYPGSGTTWTDLSGNDNTGTLVNGPTYNSANGGSIVFDGVDDCVSSFPTVISGVGSKTVNCWFKITTTAVRLGICGTRGTDGDGPAGWCFTVNRGGAGNLTYFHSNGSELQVAAGIAINTWYNGCATYNLSSATAILYLNGNQIGTPSTSFSAMSDSPFNGVIGSDNTVSQFPFSGNIATTQIYNRALTAQEIQQNFNATRSRFSI